MADQRASSSAAIVRNGHPAVRSDYIQVEVDEPVAGHGSISTRDSVRSVASRARKTGIDVDGVPGPACILDDIAREIMAFAAHRVRPVYRQIRVGIEVRNPLARTRRLAEFITSLQKVRPFRSVRTARARTAEFAVVVAVVTIRAKYLEPHQPPLTGSVQLRHVGQKTGLGVSRGTRVRHRMAGGRRRGKFRKYIARIRRVRHVPHREIPEFRFRWLARRRTVAAKAVFILVHSRHQRGNSVSGRNSIHCVLRRTK